MKFLVFPLCFFLTVGFSQKLVSYYSPKLQGRAYPSKIVPDSEGNLFVAGSFDHLNGEVAGNLLKIDRNGKSNSSFTPVFTDQAIVKVTVLPDGKLLICGYFKKLNGESTKNLVRLLPDGTVDSGFSSELDQVNGFQVQSDGRIIVTGYFNGHKGYYYIARLTSDGIVDESFTKAPGSIYSLFRPIVDSNDNIYVNDGSRVYKFKPTGTLDGSFSTGAGTESTGYISALNVTPSGRVLVGGNFTKFNGAACKNLVQLNTDGSVDTEFKVGSVEGSIYDIAIRSNNNILIGGQFYQYNGQNASLVELKSDGSLQKIVAIVSTNDIQSICETPDQKIALAGSFETVNNVARRNVVLFNSEYTINSSFKPDISYTNVSGAVFDVGSNHQVVIGGGYDVKGIYVGNTPVSSNLFKLNPLGDYEGNISEQLQYSSSITTCAVQSDNKVLVSGYLSIGPTLARVNLDGTLDNTFSVGTGATTMGTQGWINVTKYKEPTIYVAGAMDAFNGTATQAVVALNSNGSVKTAFSGLPANSYVYSLDVAPDGSVVVLGFFPFSEGNRHLARFTSQGDLDDTFPPIEINGGLSVVRVDTQNNIYVGGDLYSISGALVADLVRLKPDGSLDVSLDLGIGFTGTWSSVNSLEFLPDDQIAVGGYFEKFQDQEVNGFTILNSTGQLVPTPEVKFGPTSVAYRMKYVDNTLYLNGRFIDEGRTKVFGVAKISFVETPPPLAPEELGVTLKTTGTFELTWKDKSDNEVAFVLERSLSETDGFNTIETVFANETSTLDEAIEQNITYYYRIRAVNDGGESSYSNVASMTWIPAPSAPFELTANQEMLDEIILTWKESSTNEVGFIIERSVLNNTSFEKIDTVDADVLSYTDNEVEQNKLYYYHVVAYNSGGNSANSNEVSITSLSIPSKPEQLTARQTSIDEVALMWMDKSSNEEGFILEKSLDGGLTFSESILMEANRTQFTDAIDPLFDFYTYRIKSFNDVGESDYSDLVQIMVILGTSELSGSDVQVFPNPTADFIFLKGERVQEVSWELVNSAGQRISLQSSESGELVILDVQKTSPGIYVLRSGSGLQPQRVCIVR